MSDFLNELKLKASGLSRVVVLPESDDERVLLACDELLKDKLCKIILLGDKDEILMKASKLNCDLGSANFINPANNEYLEDFSNSLYELRKNKGLSKSQADELIKDRTYFGTMLVYKGLAHAMVSGASTTTAQTIRPALQFVKMKPGVSSVSGSFIICLKDKVWIFADCAICPKPSVDELAGIALATASTARGFGLEPKVAMLSYATANSAQGEMVDFVREAMLKARALDSTLSIDGPMQFDASVDEKVAKLKMPDSCVAGRANVFIFPDLNAGNICYKAVQRASNAVAIGPILQGLNKPINDLSRGCSVEDIVNTVLVSCLQK